LQIHNNKEKTVNKQEILTALAEGPTEQVFHFTDYSESRRCIVLGVEQISTNQWKKNAPTTWRVRIIPIWFDDKSQTVIKSYERHVSLRQLTYATGKTAAEWRAEKCAAWTESELRRTSFERNSEKLRELAPTLRLGFSVDSYRHTITFREDNLDRLVKVLTDANMVALIKQELATQEGK